MLKRKIGLALGALLFAALPAAPPPPGMTPVTARAAAVALLMAVIGQVVGNERRGAIAPALMLAVAYSAGIGGLGTLIGTPPNVIFAWAVEKLFPDMEPIGFLTWMTVAVPVFKIAL